MNKERGFLEYRRQEPGYRPREQRLKDFHAVERRLTDEELLRQALRCLDCGTPFCHGYGCPLSNISPELNEHVANQRWAEALALLLTTNPFPEFTGRVCPALCEGSCVLGLNHEPVTIRQIELAIIERGFESGLMAPRPPAARHAARVAVIGSGPAGLAVAEVLNRQGYNVVVYENARQAGGILRYGIPEFKLEKWVVERRIQLMQAEGVVFEMGVEVGKDLSYRFLQGHFNAIVLTGGAREPRDLQVPGRELKGLHFAMPFLVQQNQRLAGEPLPPEDEITAKDKAVVILGGGDTGADCLGTALRQGARRVCQFEILPEPPPTRDPRTPWPLWPLMRRDSSSHHEGGERRWSVTTKAFSGEAGHVQRLNCAEIDWLTSDRGSVPKEKPGTEFTVEADLVLLALGFVGPGRNKLVEELDLRLTPRGLIERDENQMTNLPGLFVAGDMAQGATLVVRAIADGLLTARGVMAYLAS